MEELRKENDELKKENQELKDYKEYGNLNFADKIN